MTENAYQLSKSFGYLTEGEIMALKQLVDMLPNNSTVVNIGAGAGTSAVAILEERKDLRLITIDIRYDSPLGSLQSELNAIEKSGLGDVSQRHSQILGDSKKQAVKFNEVGMVFVDGDHSRDGVRGDIFAWLQVIKPGGIIAFDDYGPNPDGEEVWPEVKKAVDELIAPGREMLVHIDSVIGFRV